MSLELYLRLWRSAWKRRGGRRSLRTGHSTDCSRRRRRAGWTLVRCLPRATAATARHFTWRDAAYLDALCERAVKEGDLAITEKRREIEKLEADRDGDGGAAWVGARCHRSSRDCTLSSSHLQSAALTRRLKAATSQLEKWTADPSQ